MSGLDFGVMGLYFAVVLGIGAYFARQAGDATDYFLGRHQIPWIAVMLSVVATETSAITVISMPGVGARTNLTFLQVTFGYLVGRIGVALWLLPGYFRGEQETAYQRLENRFGGATRRLASAVFMVVRALGDSVRVFAIAIPLSIVTGWTKLTSVSMVGLVTLVYTLAGGIKAVVWVDVLQLGMYLLGGIAAVVAAAALAGGFGEAWGAALEAGKLQTVDWSLSFSIPYTVWGGLLGGALLAAASHGTDHLIVQRLLATRNLSHARRALIGSGILVIGQFALFLLAGTLLWAAGMDDGSMPSDHIYPTFVVQHLPPGLAGLVVAGILAAAMSTMSSSLNSLASATTHDYYAPLTGTSDSTALLRVGRWATLGWAVVLTLGALAFQPNQPVVELALSIASIMYGGLLGAYLLAGVHRVQQPDVIIALVVASAFMVVVVLGPFPVLIWPGSMPLFVVEPGPFADLAWPWYVPLGLAVTMALGVGASVVRPWVWRR